MFTNKRIINDKIRTSLKKKKKMIMSEKDEPYLEIYLHDTSYNCAKRWYEPSLVLRYTYYTCEIINGKKMYMYEYEKAYLKLSREVSELQEHRNHNSCPACSSVCVTSKFVQSNELNKASQLICTCEKCSYKWTTKPDYLK